jgi:hypothetical protein
LKRIQPPGHRGIQELIFHRQDIKASNASILACHDTPIRMTFKLTHAEFLQGAVQRGRGREKILTPGEFVYVLTNPHRGRKGQIVKKRGYTQMYIRLVPKSRREFPIFVYRAKKHLQRCESNDPDELVFCQCSRDERENEEFVCPYMACYH